MKSPVISLLVMLFIVGSSFAQDYTFEIPGKESQEPKLELSGNSNVIWSLLETQEMSPFYQLQFYGQDHLDPNLSQYQVQLYLNGDYKIDNVGFHVKTHCSYLSEDAVEGTLLEAYNNLNIFNSISIEIGKRTYNWGKGYAFNTVGYVNPEKDPENPELAKEGIMSGGFEWIKSFNSDILRTLAFTFVTIPPIADINGKYGRWETTAFASKIYFLFFNTDIDILGSYNDQDSCEIGFDLSKNLLENLEIHAEVSYYPDRNKNILEGNTLRSFEVEGLSSLIGSRFLTGFNWTIIGEYYHHAAGMNRDEYQDYLTYLQNSCVSGDASVIQNAKRITKDYFGSKTLMQDYAYLKIIKQDPFGILYFVIQPNILYNLNDNSYILTPEISYKPYTNIELLLRGSFCFGDDDSEFGSKQIERRHELWASIYF